MKNLHAGAALLLLCACSGEKEGASAANVSHAAGTLVGEGGAPLAPSAASPLPKGKAASIERKDEVLEFRYKWPGEAAGVAPLDAWLRSHADGQYRKAHKDAEEARVAAKKEGYPFRRYSYDQMWDVTANLPAVLVLESNGYEFTGGAHGMPFTASLIWDRAAGKRLATGDILDKNRLTLTARDSFCAELNRQREEKRGAPVDPAAKDGIAEFNQCPVLAEHEIIPLSRKGKALDIVRVVIGPYAAGPYAEGSYEIDLPVTPEILAAVKPAYRGWFSTGTP